ncbi:hypothetical protein EMIHUDRAFT_226101 [Emiliania huxleyi CCMP1516]|uniref:SHSP domain-containing protein n=2 Tax=Emiliania huxleyi TaxID=2903 RepID=A0A0D3KLG8_EMIH1|nr:hypothetical protein EMIHUDRAFT_226101 [Emiliania huxleyi CCMP1516]EOD36603.1 hypothetical protein EMIHUDRAFT_226101 [Emiliania huxleyi CCMP1516]|eukprot:XP_005789032.1 hypothetical protein EMIHUDRAFT_226101 [Emiliania huxleyi CCMP1516]
MSDRRSSSGRRSSGSSAASEAAAEPKEEPSSKSESNPLWPSGVPLEMVEQFVEEILNDADLNIQSIPDSVEKQIYLSTVKIALNAVYKGLSSLHGMDVVGHKMIVRRLESLGAVSGIVREGLELVADRLLANPAVNQKLVPDFVERKLYINCLQLLFRLLDSLAATFRITVCGHDVRVSFEAIKDENGKSISVEERAQKLSSSLTPLDLDAWYDVLGKGRRALVSRLHTTLYALVLGIIDDFLSNTVLTFLTDRISFDIVPRSAYGGDESGGPRDVVERDSADAFTVTIEAPGLHPEDLDVSLEDGVLSVKGNTEVDSEGNKEKLVETRTVSHDICLPSSLSMIDVSAIEATTENGVLRVVVPKMLGSVKIPVRDRKLLTLASGSRGLSLTESGMRKRQLDKGDPSASGASPSPMGGGAQLLHLLKYELAYLGVLRPDRMSMFLAVGVVSLNNLLIHTPKLADASARLVPWLFVSTADHLEHHRRLTSHYAAPTISIDRLLACCFGKPARGWRPEAAIGGVGSAENATGGATGPLSRAPAACKKWLAAWRPEAAFGGVSVRSQDSDKNAIYTRVSMLDQRSLSH